MWDSLLQNGVVEEGLFESQNKAVEQHIAAVHPLIFSVLFPYIRSFISIFINYVPKIEKSSFKILKKVLIY